jgi:Ala-tRNA(Pro) deacylase
MAIPARLANFLEQHRVPYEVLHHPVAYTAQELSAVEHVSGKRHAKVVLIDAEGERVMVVLPSDQRVDLPRLEDLVGKRVELAAEDEFTSLFPDCERGAMPPFGRLYNMAMYVDRSLVANGDIVFEAGTHTDAIRMRYADFERLAKPMVGDFAEKLH